MFKKQRHFNEAIQPGLLKDLAAYLAEYEEAFPEEILSASTAASFIEESAVSYNTAPKPSEDSLMSLKSMYCMVPLIPPPSSATRIDAEVGKRGAPQIVGFPVPSLVV